MAKSAIQEFLDQQHQNRKSLPETDTEEVLKALKAILGAESFLRVFSDLQALFPLIPDNESVKGLVVQIMNSHPAPAIRLLDDRLAHIEQTRSTPAFVQNGQSSSSRTPV